MVVGSLFGSWTICRHEGRDQREHALRPWLVGCAFADQARNRTTPFEAPVTKFSPHDVDETGNGFIGRARRKGARPKFFVKIWPERWLEVSRSRMHSGANH